MVIDWNNYRKFAVHGNKIDMATTLVKYQKTQQQEDKLMDLLFSERYSTIKSKATLNNSNLLVKVVCVEFGREHFFELTPKGDNVKTTLYF